MAASDPSGNVERRLATAGRRRQKALKEVDAQTDLIRDMFPVARLAGLSILRIHQLTGISRTVLHRLERERRRA